MKLVFVWIPAELGLLEREVLPPFELPVDQVKKTTVFMAANAAGEKLPPFFVFKLKNVWDSWMAPPGEEYPETTCCNQKWLDGSRNLQ